MAASMILTRRSAVNCLRSRNVLFFAPRRHRKEYILLPDVPVDTPKTNLLMDVQIDPAFSKITPGRMVKGCAKLSFDLETDNDHHMTSFLESSKPRTFESVVAPFDSLYAHLNTAVSTARILTNIKNSQENMNSMSRVEDQADLAQSAVFTSKMSTLFKEIYANSEELTEEEKSLLRLCLFYCETKGFDLQQQPRDKLNAYIFRLRKQADTFGVRAEACKKSFALTVTDFKFIKNMPPEFLAATSLNKARPQSGPWKVTLEESNYLMYLTYCPDAEERRNIWYMYNNVSSMDHITDYLDNHKTIEEILDNRKGVANMLGYENFAQLRMEPYMATLDNVLNMVEELKEVYLPQAHKEIEELQTFSEEKGFEEKLQLCDIPYYSNIMQYEMYRKNDLYGVFRAPYIVESAMNLVQTMFGLKFVQTRKTNAVAENIFTFDTFDEEGKLVGQYYLDPYYRSSKVNGSWVRRGRERCTALGLVPYTYQSMSFDPRDDLIPWEGVYTFYRQFGNYIQQILCKTQYNLLASQGTEEDIANVMGDLLVFILKDPEYLLKIGQDEKMSKDDVNKMLQIEKHLAGYNICHRLFKIAYDMELNISYQDWMTALEEIWPLYMPLPYDLADNHPCSDLKQFQRGQAATEYFPIWSQMVALEIYNAFKEAGSLVDDEVLKYMGRRVRDTFFAPLGTVKAKELFRQFKGRDPSVDPLKAYYRVDY